MLGVRSSRFSGIVVDPQTVRSILLVRVDRIGDLVISTPTIQILRREFPNARIDLILGEKNRAIAPLVPDVDDILIWERGPLSLLSTIGRLKRDRWDLVLNLHIGTSGNADLVSALARDKHSLSIGPGSIENTEHVVQTTSRVLSSLGIEPISAENEMHHRLALRFDRSDARRGDRPVVAMNMSAGGQEREWPVDHLRALAERLSDRGIDLRPLVRPGDEEKVSALDSIQIGPPFLPTSDLGELLTLLSTIDLVVTPDCGMVHLAAAAGLPVVGLYREESTALQWRPWGVPQRLHWAEERNLASISVDDVATSTIGLLAEQRGRV